jgi:hypothetical protein
VQELQREEAVALEKSKEERREKKKEYISNGLIVKEWVPDADPPVESTRSRSRNPPPGDAPQPPASRSTRLPHHAQWEAMIASPYRGRRRWQAVLYA